jgi:hypothetical protein
LVISKTFFPVDRMRQFLLVAAVVGDAIAASPYHGSVVQVKTTSGTIIGHEASNRTDVTEFLGIRYAQAPIGNLRFVAPVPYVAPKGTIFEASEWVSESKYPKTI